ncbi:MAG TPA: hypothetical protein DDZ80_16395 [Cyanobacteria bacterium UBA8803]|nr:hypothetical protein [Cyanobacteria bacterium UBA9273]HBL59992.1 hypothetical protein [Cyanobacteria bacterium UBA8803]
MELEERYQQIQKNLEKIADFSVDNLAISRRLFHLENDRIVPRYFEVWTILAGLPLPHLLTQNFQAIVRQIAETIPANTRFYQVLPENYHWELFIIKRPEEIVDHTCLLKTPEILREVLSECPPLTFSYRGFLITADGTIIVKGYADFDEVRTQLRAKLPWASLHQSSLGHVSLGRILDPVGREYFAELKNLAIASQDKLYGELEVHTVKYVRESQWYMETKEVIAVVPFCSSVQE